MMRAGLACLAFCAAGAVHAAGAWDAAGWDDASFGRCLTALEAAQPFDATGMMALPEARVAKAHAEIPAQSWRAASGDFHATLMAFPATRNADDTAKRHVCDVRPARAINSDEVIDTFGRFLDWSTEQSQAGHYTFQSTRRIRQPGTSLALLHSTGLNPHGCQISVSLLVRPYEGLLSFSATEMASRTGCGGPDLTGESTE